MGFPRVERVPPWLAALVLLAGIALTVSPLRTRAAFQPDDYRYLRELREADAGVPGAFTQGLVVENRWDDNWWLEEGTVVRFWRPFVLPSYALDRWLFGEDELGFTVSNVLWHALAALLCFLVLRELLGSSRAALFGALLFAVGPARFEHTSYIAGRTDTFAGIGFFATLLAYARYRRSPSLGTATWTAAAFFAALLAKEYCILTPLLFPLLDACIPTSPPAPRWAWKQTHLIVTTLVAAALFLALRSYSLGEAGSGGRPFPYFHLPSRPGFLEHVAAVYLQDAIYLTTGQVGPAFLQGFGELVSTAGIPSMVVAGVLVTGLVAWALAQSGPARFCALLFAGFLAPMPALYSTGRYLYLPSLGWCGLVALVLARIAAGGPARKALSATLGCVLLVAQGGMHYAALKRLPERPAERGESDHVLALIASGEFDPEGPPAYLLDAPLFWLHTQFLNDMLAVTEGRGAPVYVLTPLVPGDSPARVEIEGRSSLVVSRGAAPLVGLHPWGDFDPAPLLPGDRVRETGYTATVLEAAAAGRPSAVRFDLPAPRAEVQVLQWRAWPPPAGFVRVP